MLSYCLHKVCWGSCSGSRTQKINNGGLIAETVLQRDKNYENISWMSLHVCFFIFFSKTIFCIKPNVPSQPKRNPSNRRLLEHGICIRRGQDSNSQPVPSRILAYSTRPQWRTCLTKKILNLKFPLIAILRFFKLFRSHLFLDIIGFFMLGGTHVRVSFQSFQIFWNLKSRKLRGQAPAAVHDVWSRSERVTQSIRGLWNDQVVIFDA